MGPLDASASGRKHTLFGTRGSTLTIAGYGIEAKPRHPVVAAHLPDGTLVFGPYDVAAARARGTIQNVLIKPGAPPTGILAKHAISEHSIVTYSSAQRGTTQLVLATGMQDYSPVLESARTSEHRGPWRILTDDHEIVWQPSMLLRLDGNLAARRGPYELAFDSSADKVVTLHGPFTGDALPRAEQLLSPGQHWVDSGTFDGVITRGSWLTAGHTLADVAWVQRYYYVPVGGDATYLVRAQTTATAADTMFTAATAIACSLRPRC